jgi:hypothetical protein
MKIATILPGNYLQHDVVDIYKEIFSISFMSRDRMSLQASCQILMNGFIWLESPNSYFIDHNVHNNSTYLTCHIVLLLLTSINFRVLDSIMSYGRSKGVIKSNEFDHSKF